MMIAPQIVGVLLKKPGQQQQHQAGNYAHHLHARIPPLDPQETKIRGELYVEDLAERCFVSIRMGWLWVEGTPMRLPLRALNLRQAEPSICQPHALALGFTLSNSKGDTLATFWADTEPIWWSWVRAIAAEIVRQTPFRAQRCLNFLGILTTCPRGPVPLPDSPTEQRRRSRSELRYWPTADLSVEKISPDQHSPSILEESRRRARSELRGWSSSNSSDEDLVALGKEHRGTIGDGTMIMQTRAWGCSESSEGSDDSLPWGAGPCRSSVDSVDSAISLGEQPTTREQRMQRYKEARRRENEARRQQVLEEDVRRRREMNNNNSSSDNANNQNQHQHQHQQQQPGKEHFEEYQLCQRYAKLREKFLGEALQDGGSPRRESPVASRPTVRSSAGEAPSTVRFEDTRQLHDNCNNNNNQSNNNSNQSHNNSSNSSSVFRKNQFNMGLTANGGTTMGILKAEAVLERRSRARERRNVRERGSQFSLPTIVSRPDIETLKERRERLGARTTPLTPTRLPEIPMDCSEPQPQRASPGSTSHPACEEDVARLLERCQRVDHYVPVREKLTLFESLSRMGGRLARSTEDLGRSSANPSPKGKQRARSLHDLNRGGLKSVPVREMCRFFENGRPEPNSPTSAPTTALFAKRELCSSSSSSSSSVSRSRHSESCTAKSAKGAREPPKNPNAPCIRTSTRRKQYAK